LNYIQDIVTRLTDILVWQDVLLLRFYAQLVLTTGTETTLENVHDAWSSWRDVTNPGHKSLVPFRKLTKEVRELDRPYMDAIR